MMDETMNKETRLLEAAKVVAKWMRWWLDQHECDCIDGHTCGWNQRKRELEELTEALISYDMWLEPPCYQPNTTLPDILDFIYVGGGVCEEQQKQWVIDQIVRMITGDNYQDWVDKYQNGDDGPETYKWDKGLAP